jgi:iron-sulfur cluster insertion protein
MITITEAASTRIAKLILDDGDPSLKLRLAVAGGGCSGFQYAFSFADNIEEDDFTVESGGVTVVVDAMSFQYLDNVKIDYVDDLTGARFTLDNPNVKSTCGCGSSFTA